MYLIALGVGARRMVVKTQREKEVLYQETIYDVSLCAYKMICTVLHNAIKAQYKYLNCILWLSHVLQQPLHLGSHLVSRNSANQGSSSC